MSSTINYHPVVRACIAIAACAVVSACVAQTPAPLRPEASAAAGRPPAPDSAAPGREAGAGPARPPLPDGPAARREAGTQPRQTRLEGSIARFVINPEGSVDGFVLKDGTLVHFPPHMGKQVVDSFRVGAPVSLIGMRSASGELRAEQIVHPDSGVRLADQPPAPDAVRLPPPAPRGAGLVRLDVSGIVDRMTTAPRGEPDGVMLRDGTVIKLTPPSAQQFSGLLQPGTSVEAQGYGSQNQYGRALQATAFGASGKLRPLYNQQPN